MAQLIPLGKITVTTAATPVQLTSVYTFANSVVIQAIPGNSGTVNIGSSTQNSGTLAGVGFILDAGQPWSSASYGLNDIDPSKLYFTASADNQSVVAMLMIR